MSFKRPVSIDKKLLEAPQIQPPPPPSGPLSPRARASSLLPTGYRTASDSSSPSRNRGSSRQRSAGSLDQGQNRDSILGGSQSPTMARREGSSSQARMDTDDEDEELGLNVNSAMGEKRERPRRLCAENANGRIEGWFIAKKEVDLEGASVIGGGATGIVLKAHWRGVDVACKVLKPQKKGSEEGRQAFEDMIQEIKFASRFVRHPNLLMFLGASVEDYNPIIVYEFMPWGSVEDFYKAKTEEIRDDVYRPPFELAARWCHHLANGLKYLHTCNPCIIHRDIKPANIFVSADISTLKIGDFGIATFKYDEGESEPRQMTGMTGSLRYMAPEVFLNSENYDEKVDIYSAAMMMYFIACGRRAYHNMAVDMQIVAQGAATSGLRPCLNVKGLESKGLKDLIVMSWAANPNERPTAADLCEGLSKMIGQPTKTGAAGKFATMKALLKFKVKTSRQVKKIREFDGLMTRLKKM